MCFTCKTNDIVVEQILKKDLSVKKAMTLTFRGDIPELTLESSFRGYVYMRIDKRGVVQYEALPEVKLFKYEHEKILNDEIEFEIGEGYHSYLTNDIILYRFNLKKLKGIIHKTLKVSIVTNWTIPKGTHVYINIHDKEIVSEIIKFPTFCGEITAKEGTSYIICKIENFLKDVYEYLTSKRGGKIRSRLAK